MLELQYKLGSKAAKWYATTDISNAFFSIPLAIAGHSLLSLDSVHLESTAPGVETKPYCLPWTDPDGSPLYITQLMLRGLKTAEGEGESSQFAEVKIIQLALDIAEQEKWSALCLYTDSWMVGNALWGWFQQWKQNNWQRRGKPIWAATLWQGIAAWVENLVVKVCHVDAHVPKGWVTEEHQNNQQVDQAAKIEVAQVDLDWQHKGELFMSPWAHDTSGHQERDATYRWAHDRGVDLTTDTIAQVIHECETWAGIKEAKWLKPLWYGGQWLK
ncbi:LOW QUALITY PROTEIN: hypothetical protein QYF61_013668 [Mycteria americana]|uniref:RNase H type-1 domain-containing protein n=1 Tax=Mycteria americana TaxID=33587 RepID=A0AAN7RVB1_MYCAM|nr:LOW QUALITY PROTEIN: hypothetical protein QYF61_013668 [Mycteria americana]